MGKQGNRVYTKIIRPDKTLMEQFRGLPIANIDDTMGRIACVDQGIKSMNGKHYMLGTAFTCRVPAGDNLIVHMALDMLEPGDILVVDGNGCMERSLVGSIMCSYAQFAKQAAGIIIDGVIRDLDGLVDLDIPIFARGAQANGPYKNGPGEIGIPVAIGGIVIHPGDIILSDSDGIIAIRPFEAEEVAANGRAVFEKEKVILKDIRENGHWDRKVFQDAYCNSGIELIEDCYPN